MQKNEFLQVADECLEHVVRWLEQFDPDEVDFATADGVVTIEFSDGARFVLNRQTAADQMWFAAGASAWHYDRGSDGAWRSDKDGHRAVRAHRRGRVGKARPRGARRRMSACSRTGA